MKTYEICPLCRKKPEQQLLGLRNYRYCGSCSLGWLKKFPKPSYGANYYKGRSNFISLLFFPISRFFYLIRATYVKKKNIELWIDVGAGEGGFLKSMSVKEKIGVEISASGRKIMKKNGLKTETEQEFLKKSRFTADVISFWHVLEHVDTPWEYLQAAYRNLKKNGVIVIGVPNQQSFEFHIFKKYWFNLAPMHHLWHYSPKSLTLMVEKENFRIEKTDFWSPEHNLAGIVQSFINRMSGSNNILHSLVKRDGNFSKVTIKDIFWCVFWCTLGLPIIIIFWIIGSLSRKSGAFVLVAKKVDPIH